MDHLFCRRQMSLVRSESRGFTLSNRRDATVLSKMGRPVLGGLGARKTQGSI